MIKLLPREMKNLSRILTICLCCVPAFNVTAAPVATTAGSNLTAYNPSNAYNNQWATISNSRYDGTTTAKVDFGNCNAVILRCAQPKCGSGCTDYSVAQQIVSGCVKSNAKCKQYGDDLIDFMAAQLVANSNAKINEQNAAIEQARIQAEAQAAAAAAASNAQSEQISQMQNQMAQMQQQMYQQQQESAQQLQEALAQQQAQSAAALQDMKTAATAAAQQTEAGITSYQQEAINRGISNDVLTRQQITGQIMTEIENAQVSLKAVKTAMQNSFDYAGCDARGNNCSVPKRIKKWRELATGFLEPYDNTIDKIYDALMTAQTVGVDLSQIYMMLNDSCNSWGQYMCEKGADVEYTDKGVRVCKGETTRECIAECRETFNNWVVNNDIRDKMGGSYENCIKNRCEVERTCKPCTLLKVLTDGADVYEGWINPSVTANDNGTVIACASNSLDMSKLFARRTKNKNGAGLVDIDKLDTWLNQVEPSIKTEPKDAVNWCYTSDQEEILKSSMSSKVVPAKGKNFCIAEIGKGGGNMSSKKDDDCPYISGTYAICDTHPFNAGKYILDDVVGKTEAQAEMRDMIALKITVISQQMYKQYEYLNATLKRLQIQLEKSVLTSNLEAAGAQSEDGSSSSGRGLVGGSSKNSQYENCSGKDLQGTLYCLRQNYSALSGQINNKKCNTNEKKQLNKDLNLLKSFLDGTAYPITWADHEPKNKAECETALSTYNIGLIKMENYIADREAERYGSRR